ncbi:MULTISPECIES: hypothetical protein [unclassified Streptomyces]|uniref:hypothetical protein n=1 Tax=unclassified Streptomyces TaxID=2593676 RepID=UPI001F042D8C|nr:MULTISPECIES: hypothetical protein [unclassified Streptomyces]MCH0562275.1 hypothetical protein [Streptomyces sp. MUM 2J]MCH0573209.1 hypothetical protein [Streptomyces sp. MUM 136J]
MNVPGRAAVDLRLLRAAVFSAVCVALSAAGHVLASGTWIPAWSLAAGWAGVLCVVGPLAGRERSQYGITLALLAGETGLHSLFCLGQLSATPAQAADRSGTVVAMAERLLCNGPAAHLTADQATRILQLARIDPARAADGVHAVSGATGTSVHGLHAMTSASMLSLPMVAAHVAAAVVTGWLLRRCEAALWRTVRLPALVSDQTARLRLLARLSTLLAAVRMEAVAVLLERLLSALAPRRMADVRARRLRSAVPWTCVARRGPPEVVTAA